MKRFHLLFIAMASIAVTSSSGLTQTVDLTKPATPETRTQYETFIKQNTPDEDAFVAVQRVAAQYIQDRQWEKAVGVFRTYRPLFPTMDKRFEKIVALLEAREEGLVVTNLGSGVNTSAGEYVPSPTADGLYLYFTALQRAGGYGGEDIFVAEWQNGAWQSATNLGGSINSNTHEGVTSISADGNRIIIFGHYQGSYGMGDIFFADKTPEGWSDFQHFPQPLNSEYWDCDGFLTSDGKAILFTSERPGGIGSLHQKGKLFHGDHWGNTDIYICLRTEDGWSEPINLSSTINTLYAERSPFLHPDGKTLYFSSDSHYGLGKLDVFKSVRLNEDSWTEWSDPVNLGKEVNTVGDDWGYKISTSGDLAYFAAWDKNQGYGNSDIFSITLPKAARPEQVATIYGKVTDGNGQPLEADIKWENLATGRNVGQLKSNPQDGSYFIVLPLGKNYGYYAEKKGYYSVSKNIDLRNKTDALNITEDINLVLIEEMKEKDVAVRINNIFFDTGEYTLQVASYPELKRLAELLKENPDMKTEIAGHTDNVGSEASNLRLSEQRAKTVVAYLAANECNSANLIAKGYGESKPVATNATEAGRQQNRRVEFKFLQVEPTN